MRGLIPLHMCRYVRLYLPLALAAELVIWAVASAGIEICCHKITPLRLY